MDLLLSILRSLKLNSITHLTVLCFYTRRNKTRRIFSKYLQKGGDIVILQSIVFFTICNGNDNSSASCFLYCTTKVSFYKIKCEIKLQPRIVKNESFETHLVNKIVSGIRSALLKTSIKTLPIS